jgi:hypothetical protein
MANLKNTRRAIPLMGLTTIRSGWAEIRTCAGRIRL